MQSSSSPEICERVRALFDYLASRLGFRNSPDGGDNRECFNYLLRYAYPEVMIDLADLIYVRHERPMVYLNFDHINMNLRCDTGSLAAKYSLKTLNARMESIFYELADTLRNDESLRDDPAIVRFLAESYGYYVFQTGNLPWDEPIHASDRPGNKLVLDIATGLVGFSLIRDWPADYPKLILTDKMPFILEALERYRMLLGKRNIETLRMDFPADTSFALPVGSIWANKFLHHLQRGERKRFLDWARERLEPGGVLSIVDTDLEYQIIRLAKDLAFHDKLIPGYPETLVEIEADFPQTLLEDIRTAGFKVRQCDSREYLEETDAFSKYPQDNIRLHFSGFEIWAEK